MANFLNVERHGRVVTLTMNRPETRNALASEADCDEFVDACHAIERDSGVAAVILTGAGGSFCAGGDLKAMKAGTGIGSAPTAVGTRTSYKQTIQRIPLAIYGLEVPTIAVVDGPAIGAGLDLACMCDIRYASDRANFAESFVKVGLIPGDGGAWFLQRLIGQSKAMELSFTGDMIDAAEALSIGLVSYVAPSDAAMEAARALAARIAANSRPAVRMTKRLIREAQDCRLDTLLEMSAAFQALAQHTAEHHELVDAFVEKRKPVLD